MYENKLTVLPNKAIIGLQYIHSYLYLFHWRRFTVAAYASVVIQMYASLSLIWIYGSRQEVTA